MRSLFFYGIFFLSLSACKQNFQFSSIPEGEIKRTFKSFEPVLAVRAMGCMNCHAKGTSVVTDFGKGSPHEMDASYFSGNHHESEAWSLSEFTKITAPSISPSKLNQWAVAMAAQDTCESGRHQEFYFEAASDKAITTDPSSGQDYRIKSVFTDKYLFAGGTHEGAPLWFHEDQNRSEVRWRLEGNQTNGYQLVSLHASGKCALIGWGNVKDRWASSHLVTCNSSAANQKFKLHPSSTPQSFQLRPRHNTNPNAYCLEVPGGDYVDPKEAIRKFIHKRSVVKNPNVEVNVLSQAPFIGAPSRNQLLTNLNQVNSKDDWFYSKNTWASIDLNKNPIRKGDFFEIEGDLTCDGDLAFKKPLVIKDLNLTTLNGCRIYVVGPVLQQGPITYISLKSESNKTNLQIISSDFISQGIGTSHCETAGSFSWYYVNGAQYENNPLKMRLTSHRPTLRANYFSDRVGYWDSLKSNFSAMGIEDASCRYAGDPTKTNLERRTLSFERLMIVAPMVQSRYIGNFKGVIVAEFVNLTLGEFKFTFDNVFKDSEVGILPLVPPQNYFELNK